MVLLQEKPDCQDDGVRSVLMGLDGKITSLTMNINVLCSARLIPTVSVTRRKGSQGHSRRCFSNTRGAAGSAGRSRRMGTWAQEPSWGS